MVSSFQKPACKAIGIQVKKEDPGQSRVSLKVPACPLRRQGRVVRSLH